MPVPGRSAGFNGFEKGLPMMIRSFVLSGSAVLAVASAAVSLPAYAAEPGSPDSLAEVVVTGSRGQPRTVLSSPTPIDVIGGEQIERLAGSMQLRDVLTQLVPSFQSTTVGSSSFNSLTRPAGLRGLSGVHVLVLVNGKRRHNSSVIDFNSGATSAGGNPVDLDLIPASAIERIEVLRDGASAQYGSDAIAGVINVILKNEASGGRAQVDAGQRYGRDGSGSDGDTLQGGASRGFAIGESGALTLSVDAKRALPAVRNSDVPGAFYFPLAGNVPDPREQTVNRRTYLGGLPEVKEIKLAQTLVLPVGEAEFYSDGTFGYREARVGQAGRKPNSNQDVIEIYPDGFTPFYTLEETDFQLTAGARTAVGAWQADFSTTYGRNEVDNGAENTLNASLGPASPTEFKTFSSSFDQWTSNADLTRRVELDGGGALQVSFGGEYRYESYETRPLDAASYISGGYFYPTGPLARRPAQVGAQGAIVVTPEDAADVSRNVLGAYVDFAWDVSDRLLLTAAGRFEDYDDSSGSVLSGKLSARYEVTDRVAVRGAVSNGFRAPSLAQQSFAQTSTSINLVSGVYVPVLTKVVKTGSSIASALGAAPLDPERSTNYSLGFSLTPAPNLSLAVDAYHIDVDDRITLTGLLSGTGIRNILIANGFSGEQSVRFFTNAVDSRTRGIDVVATHVADTDRFGTFRSTLAFNRNKTEIREVAANPPQLAGLGLTLFDRRTRGWFTESPQTKLILGVDWSLGSWAVRIKETRYDKFRLLDNSAVNDQSFGAKWITDLEVSYAATERLNVAVGAYNLLDEYPDRTTVANTIGLPPYGAGPFGLYGGYYYGRVSFNF
jgi:iron complex outermembrane receptor protein